MILSLLLTAQATPTLAQDRLPIIDMHLHAVPATSQGPPPLAMCTPLGTDLPAWDPSGRWDAAILNLMKNPACDDPIWSPLTDVELRTRTLDVLERLNVIGVLSGGVPAVGAWRGVSPDRLIPALTFNLATDGAMTPDSIRRLVEAGRLAVFGEVTNQYAGILPDDPRMEPYWALAEELDVPVGIHIGTGPPGAPYLGNARYRARMHSALTVEEVLVRHPRLRLYIMHAGYPMLDDLLAVLWTHPQVYVDVGIIDYALPRAEFYRYLQAIFTAGYGKRVMFGSDQMVWPEAIERAVRAIREAPFLSDEQKRDVLYDNAARFLRLSGEEIARHRGM